jgi:MtrB/PioB family decaheme-associated outer membrane protein
MKILSSLHLLAALGVLGAASEASAQVDTSQWRCSSCPYPKGTSGQVDAGVGTVTDSSQKFGDYTGLDEKGAFAILDGTVSHRSEEGYYADLWAADLGLDNRRLSGRAGREGLYSLNLGYAEIPRHLTEGARTPFIGSGGRVLTLPAGFPAADTASMPLGSTLQPIDTGFKYKRLDLGGTFIGGQGWSADLVLRHDERDGTRPTAGSFFSTASQFVAPVNEQTDGAELTVAYATAQLQATVSYQFSSFRNDNPGLTWSNPFLPVVPGATTGQLAQAPDNQFHQLRGTAGYDFTPTIRATGEVAWGQMTQNESFLPPTENALLAPTVPALPGPSLDGKIETFNAAVKLTAAPMQGLRVTGSYDRDSRDNRTPVRSYPIVATDMFVGPGLRNNTPFSFTLDRFKLIGDYAGGLPGNARITGGAEYDMRERTYQEVVTTREMTVWGKVAAQPTEKLSTWLKLAYSWRDNSVYGTSVWFGYLENPLLRKFYLADRRRNFIEGRLDYALSETISVGLLADYADDDYNDTTVGLVSARTTNLGIELSAAFTERTQGRAYFQTQTMRSQQNGSEAFSVPDWTGRVKDRFDVLGIGVKHVAIQDKLDIGADLTVSRSRSDVAVDNVLAAPPFPTAETSLDAIKLYATYRLKENLSITGSYHYERYDSQDWRLDGIGPATVSNLLALGAQSPDYSLSVIRVALRYRF